jgi:hypothetical protein
MVECDATGNADDGDGASPGSRRRRRVAAPPDGARVLIVEDDFAIASNLDTFLSLRGFEVDAATAARPPCTGAASIASTSSSSTSACPASTA